MVLVEEDEAAYASMDFDGDEEIDENDAWYVQYSLFLGSENSFRVFVYLCELCSRFFLDQSSL